MILFSLMNYLFIATFSLSNAIFEVVSVSIRKMSLLVRCFFKMCSHIFLISNCVMDFSSARVVKFEN